MRGSTTASKKKRRELKALTELRGNHSYLLYDLRHKAERETLIFTIDHRRRSKLVPAVAIKLVVPEASVLGREIIAARLVKKDRARR